MGIFNDYMREGKGIDKNPDNRLRIVVFFDIFFRKFWKLVTINLMYIISCIPIVTIGPATAAVTKLYRNYAREEHAFIWSDFIDTFKKNFLKALAIFFIDLVLVLLLYFDASMYLSIEGFGGDALMRVISLAVIMLSATILLFMNYYIFTLLITFKLSFKQLIKNAFIFAWIGFWRNLLITLIIAAFTLLVAIYFLPVGMVVTVLIYFSFCGLVINFITYPLIKKHMIDGYDPNTGEKIDEQQKNS